MADQPHNFESGHVEIHEDCDPALYDIIVLDRKIALEELRQSRQLLDTANNVYATIAERYTGDDSIKVVVGKEMNAFGAALDYMTKRLYAAGSR